MEVLIVLCETEREGHFPQFLSAPNLDITVRTIKEKRLLTFIEVVFVHLADGVIKLSFEPSLKLEDVERENKEVNEGGYEPPNCVPRQSVAILIPFRNREKHLLYFLHHLHPFLQRQQLHYAIYVIHQVLLDHVCSRVVQFKTKSQSSVAVSSNETFSSR